MITILLPSKPCDVYVEGTLLKSGVTDKFEMITPDLAFGSYAYKLKLVDSANPSQTKERTISGIRPGGILTVDLRDQEMASR